MNVKPPYGHLIFWATILVIGVATIYPYYLDIKIAIIDRIIFLPVWLIGTYYNWWVLIPKFFQKKKFVSYGLILFAIVTVLTIVQRYLCLYVFYPMYLWEGPSGSQTVNPFLFGKFIQFFAFIALPILLSIGIHLILEWYRQSNQARQTIMQQQSAELNYLKAQINPHFLFNTLNNLYGLSLEKSDKVPGLILKLSDILSYSLYESGTKKVRLSKEIKLIEDFISLEKERYELRMKVLFKVGHEVDGNIEISPLLLIPLVENAFKHGVKETTESIPIIIELKEEKEELTFSVINTIPSEIVNNKPGIGLKTLKRRLDLLYPASYTLETEERDNRFVATLKIKLNG